MSEEACQDLLKSCLFFAARLESIMEKNGEATERRGSIVKRGETLNEEGGVSCENPVGCSAICDSPIEIVEYIW